jgi:hypothetical protein
MELIMGISPSLQRIAELAEPALCPHPPQLPKHLRQLAGEEAASQLLMLLCLKNGFYAFARALHVFPAGCAHEDFDLTTWNDNALWRGNYGDATAGYLFFAENLFGDQFALRENRVWLFDPETATMHPYAESLEEWAARILHDPDEIGFLTAQEWKNAHGDIPTGKRLFSKIPFALGGTATLTNLYCGDPLDALRWRADLARQLKDLSPGTKVRLIVED